MICDDMSSRPGIAEPGFFSCAAYFLILFFYHWPRTRITVHLFCSGLSLLAFGYGINEYGNSRNSSLTPTKMSIEDLLSGGSIGNRHIELEEHIGMYALTYIEYNNEKKNEIDNIYYPIIRLSEKNTYFMSHDHKINNISILVKTKASKNNGSIITYNMLTTSITGMVVDPVENLSPKLKEYIKKRFPLTDLNRIIILEENKKPTLIYLVYAFIYGGALSFILCIYNAIIAINWRQCNKQN